MSNLVIERSASASPTPMLPPGLEADYAALRQLAILDGIPNNELAAAMASQGIVRRVIDRDMFVGPPPAGSSAPYRHPTGGQAAPAIYVAVGQIAAGVFDDKELTERRAAQDREERLTAEERELESLLKPPPLARVAQKNVALFLDGDVFNSAASAASHGAPIAFFTAAPSVLVFLDQRTIADLAVRYPFFEARIRRALGASRERLSGVVGVKQEILDFFVRQGLSVAGDIVRVRQLGLCIDCKLCEEACEERYGARRLTLGGYQLGMLDFIYTCRTCTDQRCIDPCEYDSIKFDTEKREVVINESTCTGCTACAQACPYGAIDMVEVDDPRSPTYKSGFKSRLEKRNALAFGPGTARIAKARRIASKCDHCATYGDQACVSACPTGSLIEVDSYTLFRERSPVLALAARAGFDQDVQSERREVLPIHPFTDPANIKSGGKAKVKRGRYAPLLFWVIGLGAFLVALTEILLRTYVPSMSYMFSELRVLSEYAGLPDSAVIEKVIYRPGSELSVYCGVVGAGLMVIAAIYPIFRRVTMFRWLASNTMYFDFHLMAGTIGPMFIILHCALRLDSWVSAAFWSMAIVVISGFVGRYLYTQVPALSSGVELEELDHERAFHIARQQHPQAMADLDREMAEHRVRAEGVARSTSVIGAMWWLLSQDVASPTRYFSRKGNVGRYGLVGKARRDLVKRVGRMIKVQRSQVVAPKAQLLLHAWKKVHVPFTVLLTALGAVHIWDAWSRAW
jgi:Fe-S-cluster-containing hydrogenase component 2